MPLKKFKMDAQNAGVRELSDMVSKRQVSARFLEDGDVLYIDMDESYGAIPGAHAIEYVRSAGFEPRKIRMKTLPVSAESIDISREKPDTSVYAVIGKGNGSVAGFLNHYNDFIAGKGIPFPSRLIVKKAGNGLNKYGVSFYVNPGEEDASMMNSLKIYPVQYMTMG